MSRYVTMAVSADARQRLRSLAYALTGASGQQVTLTDALLAACAVADRHREEAVAVLTSPQTGDSQ